MSGGEDQRITRLEDKVEKLEVRLTDKITEVDKTLGIFIALFEKNLEVQERLSDSIDKLSNSSYEMKIAMTKIQSEITDVKEIAIKSDRKREEDTQILNKKILDVKTETDTKIFTLDEKGKIDWMILGKKSLSEIIGLVFNTLGFVAIVFYFIKDFLK